MPTIIQYEQAAAGHCEGCLEKLDAISQALGYTVCLPCTKARCRATSTHRCSCGQKRREAIIDYGFRTEKKCSRCLGHIR